MDAANGPLCRCGSNSTYESGWCGKCSLHPNAIKLINSLFYLDPDYVNQFGEMKLSLKELLNHIQKHYPSASMDNIEFNIFAADEEFCEDADSGVIYRYFYKWRKIIFHKSRIPTQLNWN